MVRYEQSSECTQAVRRSIRWGEAWMDENENYSYPLISSISGSDPLYLPSSETSSDWADICPNRHKNETMIGNSEPNCWVCNGWSNLKPISGGLVWAKLSQIIVENLVSKDLKVECVQFIGIWRCFKMIWWTNQDGKFVFDTVIGYIFRYANIIIIIISCCVNTNRWQSDRHYMKMIILNRRFIVYLLRSAEKILIKFYQGTELKWEITDVEMKHDDSKAHLNGYHVQLGIWTMLSKHENV